MIYLDSSAIALRDWLNVRSEPPITSVLAEVEVPRALRRSAPAQLAAMQSVLARISRMEMDAAIRATAGADVVDALRSVDAIHLATAAVEYRRPDGPQGTSGPSSGVWSGLMEPCGRSGPGEGA